MNSIRITKIFTFEMAHALWNHSGKCKNIHGHSYVFHVCLSGKVRNESAHPEDGMIMDFGKLKQIVKKHIIEEFDHAFVINSNSLGKDGCNSKVNGFDNVKYIDFQPTSENLIAYFAEVLKDNLPEGIFLHSLKLQETATSFVEWFAD